MKAFNPALCEERHDDIKKDRVEMFNRLKAIEGRWLVLMTALAANLVGVIAILITK